MNERIEAELKARLCYTNAKIYIKLLNEDREELPANSNAANSSDEVSSVESSFPLIPWLFRSDRTYQTIHATNQVRPSGTLN